MNDAVSHSNSRRASYILSLWAEPQDDAPPVWRGSLEAANGRRLYFDSLGSLNRLLGESAGWRDPAASPPASFPDDSCIVIGRGERGFSCLTSTTVRSVRDSAEGES